MKRQFSPASLDVQAFAEEGGQLSGVSAAKDFGRLAGEVLPQGAGNTVDWSAAGELRDPQHVNPQAWLHLQARAVLQLTCQRCLEPVDVALDIDRHFRFAPDEATAAAQDDQSEEDVLAMSRTFDLLELVEDELLIELPAVPRHKACPAPVRLSVADPGFEDVAPPEHPFAVLRGLKAGKH